MEGRLHNYCLILYVFITVCYKLNSDLRYIVPVYCGVNFVPSISFLDVCSSCTQSLSKIGFV